MGNAYLPYLIFLLPIVYVVIRASNGKVKSVLYPLVFIYMITAFLFHMAVEQERRTAEIEFTAFARDMYKSLLDEIDQDLFVLESLKNFYKASRFVDRREFEIFTRSFVQKRSIIALEWAPLVQESERKRFEALAQDDGLDGFSIRKWQSKRSEANGQHELEYYPIYYSKSLEGNRGTLGVDLRFTESIEAAMRRSRKSGSTIATELVSLDSQENTQQGFLVLVPIYKNHSPAEFQGFLTGVYDIEHVVMSAIDQFMDENITIDVRDVTTQSQPASSTHNTLFFTGNASSYFHPMERAFQFRVAGRQWELHISKEALPYFFNLFEPFERPLSFAALLWGFLFSSAASGFLLTVAGRAAFVREQVAEKTLELDAVNQNLQRRVEKEKDLQKIAEDHRFIAYSIAQDAKRAQQLAELKNTYFEAVISSTPSGLLGIDARGHITLVNESLLQMFGYSREELIGENVEILLPHAMREKYSECMKGYLASPALIPMEHGRDLIGRRKGGDVFSVEIGYRPVKKSGDIVALAALSDITERKKAEEELYRSNQDLDQFAYVASHDLKSPLRAIANYAEWIVEDAGEVLPEDSKGHLHKLRERIVRMQQLLDDLLAYSRVGRMDEDIISVDTKTLIEDLADLNEVPEGFKIIVEKDLPRIETSKVPLEMVFRNLIGNAVKHHDRIDGMVSVSGKTNGTFCEFVVADDGPGIAAEYHEKIFQMFQSLNPNSGTGMGLALVKKLVESQGGKITVESEEGNGTVFRFTWPFRSGLYENSFIEGETSS